MNYNNTLRHAGLFRYAKKLALLALLLPINQVFADIKLPSIITDNMVLQQKSTVTLWGWATPGEKVIVEPLWTKMAMVTKADNSGNWKVELTTPAANGIATSITFKGNNSITVKNVMLGEVWLCSGQSNMQFTLAKGPSGWETGVNDFETEVAKVNNSKIRMYTVKQTVGDTLMKDTQGEWQEANPQNARLFSAVAYYYGRELFAKLNVPIGLINSTWGGTPAESWTKKEVLAADADLNVILTRYQNKLANYPQDMYKYEADFAKWKTDTATAKQQHSPLPKAPAKPTGAGDSKSPYKLYNGMIAPIVPYTVKGVIWYQGESNADRAYQYRKLFPAMIKSWREDHHNNNLPFYFVQISPHYTQNAEIREAQLFTYKTVPHTGMVVSIDNGDSANIHPRNKEIIGKRLALWPLTHDYGFKNIPYSGPLYKSMKVEAGGQIRIYFDEAAGGLMAKDGDLKEFTVAAEDRIFHSAQAKIDGNTLLISSAQVANPVAVRFAWRSIPAPNLYNKAGLPASPFRTDIWPVLTEGKN
jgi:sialate O-acetylesterase